MPNEAARAGARPAPPQPASWSAWLNHWPLLVGFAPLLAVTAMGLSSAVWTREDGAHGPIVLATAGWLLWRSGGALRAAAQPAPAWLVALIFAPSLLVFTLGHAIDFISVETAGLYGLGLALGFSLFGWTAIRANWFPFLYPAFMIPPPEWLLDQATAPLKQFVSAVVTAVLSGAGLPVSHEGVTIHVAQYDLLVKEACSGMNSLTGLVAISLLYIYLLRGSSVRYAVVLTAFAMPIAVLGNILRVMLLVLLTYWFGAEAAQGIAHEMAGVFLFAVDLALVFAVDFVLARTLPAKWRPQ